MRRWAASIGLMLEIIDFYRILQVDPRAEPEVIKAAHRTLARLYHPDVTGGSEARMVAINQAWSVLGDPLAREAYDRGRSVLSTAPSAPAPRATEPSWAPGVGRPQGPPSGTVLDFGRYAGWSFGQIERHDPDFLEWLARAPIGRSFRAEIEALLASRARPATTTPAPPRKRGFTRR
jgi:curved DNA-binding protein CbpA